jgi:uncharacterized phiE125 gp8 family phage protein
MLDDVNALISWEYAKQMLSLDEDEINVIHSLINAASIAANHYTHRKIKARNYTVQLDSYGGETLLLPEAPVNVLTSVHIDTDRDFGADTEVTDDIILYSEGGTIVYKNNFPDNYQCVKVVYNAGYGYDGEAIPYDIQLAMVETVQWYRARISGQGIGVTAIQNPDGITTRFEADLPVSAKRRLEPYIRMSM